MVTAVDHTHVYNTTVFRFVHRRCPSVERAPNAMVSTTKLFANVHRDTEAIQGSLASFLVARVTLIVPRTKPASTIAARIPASKILALEIWIATFIITWWNVHVLLATSRILKRAALNVGIINYQLSVLLFVSIVRYNFLLSTFLISDRKMQSGQ